MQLFVLAVSAAACATQIAAMPTFVALIPGSSNVEGVDSVGHINPAGGGQPNPFGLDFKAAKTTWTVELCYKDSDGDEQFNGAELGDPCCEWVKDSNEKLAYDTASGPGDKTSKQDPTIWAAVKCADGSDPVTKFKAHMAKAGGAAAAAGSDAAAPAGSSAEDVIAPAVSSNSSTPSAASTPAPATTTAMPASGAAQAVAAASTVAVAVAALLL